MQLIRTCAAWRPDASAFRDPVCATRIALKSLARRYLELDDEVAELDVMIAPLVRELAPSLLERPGFGIEGTGSYGAGLLRHLQQAGLEICEVNRPDRSDRRRRGKDDTLDAENAAHAALAGHRVITPKTRDGMVEALRVLRVARTTAVKARRVALQMLRMQIVSAPELGV